jgi:hypothetical protein
LLASSAFPTATPLNEAAGRLPQLTRSERPAAASARQPGGLDEAAQTSVEHGHVVRGAIRHVEGVRRQVERDAAGT